MKTQEVRILQQLILEVDVNLNKEQIEAQISEQLNRRFLNNKKQIFVHSADIIEIEEESEIYGNEQS